MIVRDSNLNTSRVLRLIALKKGISRVKIAHVLKLDKSSVSCIVNRLLEQGIVHETTVGKAGVKGGRRPVSLAIKGSYGVILGLELQAKFYRLVVLDLDGQVLETDSNALELGRGNLVQTLLKLVARMRQRLAARQLPILGVGLGLSGVVDYHQGRILQSIPLEITHPLSLLKEIGDQLDVPLFMDNDANCIGWGELAFHKPRLLKDFVCVLLRRWQRDEIPDHSASIGVGLGLVFHGLVFHGQGYSAGEFRSLLWKQGNRGQFSLSDEHLESVDKDGFLFESMGRELARHLAFVVNTFNLSHVTLCGAFAHRFGDLSQWIQESIEKNWPYDEPVNCEILTSAMGEDAVAYGAAGMVLERIFEHPEVPDGTRVQIPAGLNILLNR